ncbi:large conductance mechanosensitive channel protein MscL [Helcococcus kunzii]|uniref:large conductance mechanosensitive channel protein MscL n=1 Tax=Helcococcus kunzii TaxID=40091 RepID=UPI0038B02360
MLKEFKEFIAEGNVLEVAVGFIMASTFGAIVKSLVEDILTPLISAATAGIDFKDWVVNVAGVKLGVGIFVNTIITFLITAFVMFLIVKTFNRFKKKEAVEEDVEEPTKEEVLLTEIRDLLKK